MSSTYPVHERRVMNMAVPVEDVMNYMVAGGTICSDSMNLPSGVSIQESYRHDDTVVLRVSHGSFPKIPIGEQIPTYAARIRTDDNGVSKGYHQHRLDAAFRMNVEAFFDAHPRIYREFTFFQFKRVAQWVGDAGVHIESMEFGVDKPGSG